MPGPLDDLIDRVEQEPEAAAPSGPLQDLIDRVEAEPDAQAQTPQAPAGFGAQGEQVRQESREAQSAVGVPQGPLAALDRGPATRRFQLRQQRDARLKQLRDASLTESVANLGTEDNVPRFVPDEGLDDFGMEFDLARSRHFSDEPLAAIRDKYRRAHPDGEVVEIPDPVNKRMVLLFSPDGKEYREIKEMSGGEVAAGLLSGTMAGGAAAAQATPIGRFATPLAMGAGTLGGNMADRAIEDLRGVEGSTSFPYVTRQGATEAALATVMEKMFGPSRFVTRTGHLQRRVMGAQITDEAIRADEAARELGLQPIVIGQSLKQPVLRDLYRQAGAIVAKPGEVSAGNLKSIREYLERAASGDTGSLDSAELAKAVVASRENLSTELTRASRVISGRGTPFDQLPRETAETLRTAFERWDRVTRAFRDRAYAIPRRIAPGSDIEYTINEAWQLSDGFLNGRVFRRRLTQEEIDAGIDPVIALSPSASPGLVGLLRELHGLDTNIRAIPIERTLPDGTVVRTPVIPGRHPDERTAFDQLKELREEFFNYRYSENGADRRIANEIWFSLKRSMENPTVPAGLPPERAEALRVAHANASRIHAERESILELRMISRAFDDSLTPEEFAERFFQPGRPTATKLAKQMSGKYWTQLQHGFASNLSRKAFIDGPESALKELQRWRVNDPEGLGTLMRPDIVASFETWANGMASLENALLTKQAAARQSSAETALSLVRTVKTEADADELLAELSVQQLEDFKRGLFFDLLNRSSETVTRGTAGLGEKSTNPDALIAAIEKIEANGPLMRMLDKDGKDALTMLRGYAAHIRSAVDTANALKRASITGKLSRTYEFVLPPYRPLFAGKELSEYRLWAEVLSIPIARALAPKLPFGFTNDRLRGLAGAATTAAVEALRQERNRKGLDNAPQ